MQNKFSKKPNLINIQIQTAFESKVFDILQPKQLNFKIKKKRKTKIGATKGYFRFFIVFFFLKTEKKNLSSIQIFKIQE